MESLKINSVIQPFSLKDIDGNLITIPQTQKIIHLQFRRFSGCPICSVHMNELKKRVQEIASSGVVGVVVFYSEEEDIRYNLSEIPYSIVEDSQRIWYAKFGVEESIKSVLNPIAWPYAVMGAIHNISKLFSFFPRKQESMFGLPAEFLINDEGKLLDVKYGSHAYDQWTVDELLNKISSYENKGCV